MQDHRVLLQGQQNKLLQGQGNKVNMVSLMVNNFIIINHYYLELLVFSLVNVCISCVYVLLGYTVMQCTYDQI